MKTINIDPRRILLFSGLLIAGLPMSSAFAQSRVQAEPLHQIKIPVNRSVPAEVISLRQATISSQLTSTVVELPLLVGDTIHKDELIAELDCSDNQLALQQSGAELSALSSSRVLARQQLDRLNKLRLSNNASEEQVNQKQAELNVVSAQIKGQSIAINMAERQVEKCRIHAPFSGVVTRVHSEVGNFVTPGSAIVSVVDTDNIELSARVGHTEIDPIISSDSLLFLFQGQTFPVSTRATLPVIDTTTQSQHMRLDFIDLKPPVGAIGRLQWSLSGNILPAPFILARNNQNGVFIIDDSVDDGAVARFVTIPGAKQGQPAAVVMDPDTRIITDGRFGLADGDAVIID